MEPLPIGTLVNYHGSQTQYVITEHHLVSTDLFRRFELEQLVINGTSLHDAYPDGVAYSILPEGMLVKFGNVRTYGISRVRRGSLSVVKENPQEPLDKPGKLE